MPRNIDLGQHPAGQHVLGCVSTRPLRTMFPIKFSTLDVRPLLARGEEPLAIIRARVAALQAGRGLTIVAPFMPAPLVELLQSEGFKTSLEHRGDGAWAVSFWRE
jgi:uncharacterized protein (DUF2249 family)